MKRPSEILKVKFQTAFDFKPWLQMRVHQVFGRQDAVEFRFAQQAAFEYDFAHAFAGLGADFADQIAVVVADVRIQISDQTDGVENIAFADVAVDRNAFDAFFGQVDCGVAQEGNGFKHTLGDDRLHNVQL